MHHIEGPHMLEWEYTWLFPTCQGTLLTISSHLALSCPREVIRSLARQI